MDRYLPAGYFNLYPGIRGESVYGKFVQSGFGRALLSSSIPMGFLSLAEFDAKGDGVTDDTAAIQAWMVAEPGRIHYWPRGRYLVRKLSGTEVLLWSRPMYIVGEGARDRSSVNADNHGTVLLIASDVPTSMDAIRIAVDPTLDNGEGLFFWGMTGVRIKSQSGAPGRDCVFLDIPDSASAFHSRFDFRGNWFGPLSRRAFAMTKAGATINGYFTSVIESNRFDGGASSDRVMSLHRSGDSLTVHDNTITGGGIGIYTEPVTGAAIQKFTCNNITATGGAFYSVGGTQMLLEDNQMEQSFDYTGTDGAMVVLNGSTRCVLRGNNLNAYDQVDCIRLRGAAAGNNIEDNVMAVDSAHNHYVIDAGAVRNRFGQQRILLVDDAEVIYPRVSDSSTEAQYGIFKKLTLSNSWVDGTDANYDQGLFVRREGGHTQMKGTIGGGTIVAGTTIATLPSGLRPQGKARRIDVKVFNGTSWSLGICNVNTAGQINTLSIGANNIVQFDGVSMPVDQ